jgi:phosphoglycolate phosphatase-like HAD superfamily hydrolase
MTSHIVWDWNGTLFHDIDAVVEATNASFAQLGIEPISLERYREVYCVPVSRFYERLVGRLPTGDEWSVMDAIFHRHYWTLAEACALAPGAADLLSAHQAAGRTQSLCSLAPHDRLVPLVRTHGIEERFVRVDGSVERLVEGKARHLERHLARIEDVEPTRVVVIGDALDDATAAAHVGVHAVLYTGGSHCRAALEGAGVPVVDSLADAVETAGRLVAGSARP